VYAPSVLYIDGSLFGSSQCQNLISKAVLLVIYSEKHPTPLGSDPRGAILNLTACTGQRQHAVHAAAVPRYFAFSSDGECQEYL
jgi:hypothetical protein